MFGFGLQKLIVLALIIGAVWYGYKFLGRLEGARGPVRKATGKPSGRVSRESEPAAAEPAAEDMERCETCGDFVATGRATACGRDACPYHR